GNEIFGAEQRGASLLHPPRLHRQRVPWRSGPLSPPRLSSRTAFFRSGKESAISIKGCTLQSAIKAPCCKDVLLAPFFFLHLLSSATCFRNGAFGKEKARSPRGCIVAQRPLAAKRESAAPTCSLAGLPRPGNKPVKFSFGRRRAARPPAPSPI
ncbi:UNVERIFIED_CONTAM: hypothetical protein K2H54_055108, partial [Gekko kuhli]